MIGIYNSTSDPIKLQELESSYVKAVTHYPLAWILHEGGIYKNKMAISLISGHGYVNFHLNYV